MLFRQLARRLLLVLQLSAFAASAQAQWWTVQTSGIDTNLRAVSAAWTHDANGEPSPVVWASGSHGVILRSNDEGKTWKRLHVQDGDSLDIRGIVAFDDGIAYVMSIGNGEQSRIYKTIDAGQTWKLQFIGKRKETFLDAIACPDVENCFALGDPIAGKFLLLATRDGEHWKELPRDKMPAALPNEGAFAASNSSLLIYEKNIYFGTGGASVARVFHSRDLGVSWTAVNTPIASGNASSGIFSLYNQGNPTIFVVGGDYKDPGRGSCSAAHSTDGGDTWKASAQQPGGFRSAVSYDGGAVAVSVGPTGEDVSQDQAVTWQSTDSLNLNAVTILDEFRGWAVGPHGTIARFVDQVHYIMRNYASGIGPNSIRTGCCLLGPPWLSTLTRSSQADFIPSKQKSGTSPSATIGKRSNTGRQDAIEIH